MDRRITSEHVLKLVLTGSTKVTLSPTVEPAASVKSSEESCMGKELWVLQATHTVFDKSVSMRTGIFLLKEEAR